MPFIEATVCQFSMRIRLCIRFAHYLPGSISIRSIWCFVYCFWFNRTISMLIKASHKWLLNANSLITFKKYCTDFNELKWFHKIDFIRTAQRNGVHSTLHMHLTGVAFSAISSHIILLTRCSVSAASLANNRLLIFSNEREEKMNNHSKTMSCIISSTHHRFCFFGRIRWRTFNRGKNNCAKNKTKPML